MTEEILGVGEYFNLIGILSNGRPYKEARYPKMRSLPGLNQMLRKETINKQMLITGIMQIPVVCYLDTKMETKV